jgi:ferric-dicitrate binding protein FerR (iron transport regulator)
MKLQQNNNWDAIAMSLAKENEEGHHLYADLSDEDKMILDIMEDIKLDCDYKQAFRIKEEVLEKTYHKIFDDQETSNRKNNRNPFIVLFTIAASIAVLLSLSTIYLYRTGTIPPTETGKVVFFSSDAVSNVILPDSTVVSLNKGSRLSYKTDYNRSERKVELTGEAYFDVRPNAGKPFIVSTGRVDINVLGTVFNVSAYPEDNEIRTSLISGSVRLTGKENEVLCQLQPNQSAIYDKESSYVEIAPFDPDYTIGWTTGKLLFKKTLFREICKTLEKKFNCSIEVKNEVIHQKLFTGKFQNDETLPEILNIIQINIPFRYEVENNHITIY